VLRVIRDWSDGQTAAAGKGVGAIKYERRIASISYYWYLEAMNMGRMFGVTMIDLWASVKRGK